MPILARQSILSIAIIGAISLLSACDAAEDTTYQPKEGDILFQSLPHNEIIDAIEGATGSPFSHCGIVVSKPNGLHVLEAIGPVRETPLFQWRLQGRQQRIAAYRLKPAYQEKIAVMIEQARKFMGLPYDIQYEFDDQKIYCSELIYKGFKSATGEPMGVTRKLGDLNWKPHEPVIRAITGRLPLEREMITPKDLAEAKQLDCVKAWDDSKKKVAKK